MVANKALLGRQLQPYMKLYNPRLNDQIIGIVESQVSGEYYRIHINSTEFAMISNMSFKNAVKKNKKQLQPGDVIVCNIIETDPDPLLCAKETVGSLEKGMVVHVNCKFSQAFDAYKQHLVRHFKIKSRSSPNGFIHFDTEDVASNFLCYQIIQQGQYMSLDAFKTFVDQRINI